jgi:gag-polypeptide of LTR copia-type
MSQNIEKLTSVLLNGKNYHLWIRQATFGLIGRDRLEHVNGEKPMPQLSIPPLAPEMKAVKAWMKDDNQTCSLLIASMEPHVAELMSYQDTAKEMWDKAARLFSRKKNYAHIYQIQLEMQQAKQQTQSVMELFSYLEKKKEELRMYRPPTTDLSEIRRREEQDDIFRFLAALDVSYEQARSQILLSSELPSIDEVAEMIQREETRRAVMGQPTMENPEVKAYISGSRTIPNPRYGNRGEQLKCEYCKREGHTKEKCWHLHPELRPKGLRRGDDRWQGEKNRRSYVTQKGERVEFPAERVKGHTSAENKVDPTISPD